MAYAINTIKISLEYIKQFDIKDCQHFNTLTENLDIDANLIKSEKLKTLQREEIIKAEEHIEKIRKININSAQKGKHRTGNFKGTGFLTEKNMWSAQLQHNKNTTFFRIFSG